MPDGCPFAPRCNKAMKVCLQNKPMEMMINDSHISNCWQNVKEAVENKTLTKKKWRRCIIMNKENKYLLEVKNLKQHFDIPMGLIKSKPLKAVDDISFNIKHGETLGLVGESGCGKTTVGRSVLQLYKPTAGEVINGEKKQEFHRKSKKKCTDGVSRPLFFVRSKNDGRRYYW